MTTMTTSVTTEPVTFAEGLDRLDPVGLDELVETASLQTRVDRKYLVPLTALDDLVDSLEPGTRVLQIGGARRFGYESVYFDTLDLACYLATAHRRRHRVKIRTRAYLDTDRCFVEVKTRGPRGVTVKTREPYELDDRGELTPDGWRFARAVLDEAEVALVADDDERHTGAVPPGLVATLISRYDRVTLLLPSSGARATIDTALTWAAPDDDDAGAGARLVGLAVVETKTGSTPSSVDRALWRAGHRPVPLSKYGTGMAALHPDLPATRWHRTLEQVVRPALAPATD
jgi:hypothetical protein